MTPSSCFQHPDAATLHVKCATARGVEAVMLLGVLLPLALGMGGCTSEGGKASPAGETFDYGTKAALITRLQRELANQPCDKTKGREYAQALFEAGDLKGTVKAADGFIEKCGKSTALRQLSYTANTQLREFERAAKDVTELLDGAPNNANYYLWRGMAHEANGAIDAAVADFRQAFLLKPEAPQAVNLLATAYGNRGEACEARLAVLEHLLVQPAKAQDPQMLERLRELAGASQCDIDGKGRAELAFQPKGPRVVQAKVGKEQGRFLVDRDSARVVLSKAFADRLGLSLEGAPSARLQAAHDILTIHLVKVPAIELQGARAANVEVAVADTLPEGADGLLGLSFLARFRVQEDAKAGRLQLLAR